MPEINLHNGDCLAAMRKMPDDAYELAIVDPPYGLGESGGKTATRKGKSKAWKNQKVVNYKAKSWDNEPASAEYFKEVTRVSKNQIIWGANHFISRLPRTDSPCWVVWYKAGQNPNSDFADCELAWCSFKKAVRMFRFDWTGFGAVNAKETRIHPTQKPVALYKWLLSNYAKDGDRILDTHLGSGSIAIACHDAGFDLDGWELDADYYAAACKRLTQHQRQQQFAF